MDINISALAVWRNNPVTVAAAGGDKITIADVSGNTRSVRTKDIEILHPGPVKNIPEPLPPPEWQEIIELAGNEKLDFAEWVELSWGEWTPAAAWSGYCVLQDGLYWEGSASGGVSARSPEEVAATLAKRHAKDARKEQFNALVQRIKEGNILPEDELPMREIVAVARGERDKSALLEALKVETAPRSAHRLLLRCGAVDDSFNPYPARYGTGYPGGRCENEAVEIPEWSGDFRKFDCPAVAIDAACSNDPDDALSPAADGSLWVHVANPADLIPVDSPVDAAARNCGVTLYLPEGTVPMLPEKFVDVCGLGLQQKSRALSFHIGFNGDGSVFLKEFCRTELKVDRMTYEEADSLYDHPAWQKTLENLEKYEKFRRLAGGIELTLPEFDIFVDKEKNISLHEVVDNAGRRLVRNAMVAAGNAAAVWAVENDVVMPFACQSFAEDAPEWGEFDGSWVESFRRRQYFQPTSVSAVPGKHAGLGIEPYVRITSPLRRYADLLAHRQFLNVIDGKETMDSEAVERQLCYSEEGAKARRNAERDSNAHWLTVYLKRLGEWQGRAVKLGEVREKSVFLLPELGMEVRTRWGIGIENGTALTAFLKNADIPDSECKFDFK